MGNGSARRTLDRVVGLRAVVARGTALLERVEVLVVSRVVGGDPALQEVFDGLFAVEKLAALDELGDLRVEVVPE